MGLWSLPREEGALADAELQRAEDGKPAIDAEPQAQAPAGSEGPRRLAVLSSRPEVGCALLVSSCGSPPPSKPKICDPGGLCQRKG